MAYGDIGDQSFGFGDLAAPGLGPTTNPIGDNPYGLSGLGDYGQDPFNYFGDFGSLGNSPSYSDNGMSAFTGSGENLDSGMSDYFNPNEEEDRKTRTPGMTMGMGPKVPGFWDSGLGKVLRGVTSLHPAGRLGWGAYDLAQGKNPIQVAANQLPGLPGMFARTAMDASQNGFGPAVGTTAGGMAGGMLGNSISPGLGAITGPLGASMGRSMASGQGIPGQSQGNQNGLDVNSLLSGLSGLYSSNEARKELGGNQDAINGQISSLSGMYGPDSPYAKQLRQQLERKDAASGRNSQYGPREAQLQALLADKAAGTAGTIGQLTQQSQRLNDQRTQQRNQQLGILLGMGQRSGLFSGLSGMFNSGSAPADNYIPMQEGGGY